ncbi:Transcriptional regulator WhiB2 [Streptomyces sp. RB17]|nr:Transcriptional regulator WhiB2 [Streptomyces sp. RB17]
MRRWGRGSIIGGGRSPAGGVDRPLIERFSPRGTILGMHFETITPADDTWQAQALCAQTGPDFFFPEPGSSVREAKRICAMCELRPACLDYALANDERFGVWGGLSEKERLALRRTSH